MGRGAGWIKITSRVSSLTCQGFKCCASNGAQPFVAAFHILPFNARRQGCPSFPLSSTRPCRSAPFPPSYHQHLLCTLNSGCAGDRSRARVSLVSSRRPYPADSCTNPSGTNLETPRNRILWADAALRYERAECAAGKYITMASRMHLYARQTDVVDQVTGIKQTFSSWDNCMAKSYCK